MSDAALYLGGGSITWTVWDTLLQRIISS